jgi:hypothetical protein
MSQQFFLINGDILDKLSSELTLILRTNYLR